jgi:hypothetical protein
MHDQLQLDIIEEWWKWHGQQWSQFILPFVVLLWEKRD